MSYIEEIEPSEAEGDLTEIYGRLMGSRGGRLPGVMKVLGLKPELLRQVEALNHVISFGGSVLGRKWEEMLATLVSAKNGCHY